MGNCLWAQVEVLKPRLKDAKMDKRMMKEMLVRLMYVEMLGHDASWGHVKALQVFPFPGCKSLSSLPPQKSPLHFVEHSFIVNGLHGVDFKTVPDYQEGMRCWTGQPCKTWQLNPGFFPYLQLVHE